MVLPSLSLQSLAIPIAVTQALLWCVYSQRQYLAQNLIIKESKIWESTPSTRPWVDEMCTDFLQHQGVWFLLLWQTFQKQPLLTGSNEHKIFVEKSVLIQENWCKESPPTADWLHHEKGGGALLEFLMSAGKSLGLNYFSTYSTHNQMNIF